MITRLLVHNAQEKEITMYNRKISDHYDNAMTIHLCVVNTIVKYASNPRINSIAAGIAMHLYNVLGSFACRCSLLPFHAKKIGSTLNESDAFLANASREGLARIILFELLISMRYKFHE